MANVKEDFDFVQMKRFGTSALVATLIILAGVFIGGQLVFGFGIFMLVIIGLLSMLAVVEFVIGMV